MFWEKKSDSYVKFENNGRPVVLELPKQYGILRLKGTSQVERDSMRVNMTSKMH